MSSNQQLVIILLIPGFPCPQHYLLYWSIEAMIFWLRLKLQPLGTSLDCRYHTMSRSTSLLTMARTIPWPAHLDVTL